MKYDLPGKALCWMIAGITFLYGCDNNPVPPVTDADNITLETAVWQLTEISVCPNPIKVPDTLPVPITIKFFDNKIEGFGGCNSFSGVYTPEGSQLKITEIVRTEMFCANTSAWEDNFLGNLEYSRGYKIKGETLEIDCGDMGGLQFRLNWKKRKGE